MTKQKIFTIISCLLIASAIGIRFFNVTARAPFDWDQDRDYAEVAKIAEGKMTLVGPVAKGDGGFLLGPLYYYLTVPAYILMGGSPVALPATSILIDISAIIAILYLLPQLIGKKAALTIAAIWTFSWFSIEASRISWNVALIPLWSVIYIYLLALPVIRLRHSLLLGIMTGLTWHIHAALIPLAPMMLLTRYKEFTRVRHFLFVCCGYGLALSPLILFDLRHAGLERHLIQQFLYANSGVSYSLSEVIFSVTARLGKNTVSILTSRNDLNPTAGVLTLVCALLGLFNRIRVVRVAGLMIILNTILVVALRESGFPEYYLAASYLPTILLVAHATIDMTKKRISILVTVFIAFIYLNLRSYTTASTPYSMCHKLEIATVVSKLGSNVKIINDLPYGRERGIVPLIKRRGVDVMDQAGTQVLMTEKKDKTLFIDGEIAHDLGWFGGFRLATNRRVQ